MAEVVITGIGPVAALGIGKEIFFQNLYNNKMIVKMVPAEFEKNYTFLSRFYVPAPQIPKNLEIITPQLYRLIDKNSLYAVSGAFLALKDAGLTISKDSKYYSVKGLDRAGIILGVGSSYLESAFNGYSTNFAKRESLLEQGLPGNFPKLAALHTMTNAAAAYLSIIYNIQGPAFCLNAACASGTVAIGEAYLKIKTGQADSMLCGGVECLDDRLGSTMRSFDQLGVLTRSVDGNPRPFSKKRSGFLFCMGGAGILLLENKKHALKRGATIYAEIIDYKYNSDAYHIFQTEPEGKMIKKIIEELKKDKKIDYINCHGTGTIINDEVESRVIRNIFGAKDKQPWLNATKGLLGHSIAASGALETIVTAFSIKNGQIHGSPDSNPLEDINLLTKSESHKINYALTTSYGFGGHNAGLLLKKAVSKVL